MAKRRHLPYDMPQSRALAEGLATLTPREREVIDYLAEGKPNKVIAIELGISQRTAEAHRARIFTKLDVRNAVELVRLLFGPPLHLTEPPPVITDEPAGSPIQGELAFSGPPPGRVPSGADTLDLPDGRPADPLYLQAGAG